VKQTESLRSIGDYCSDHGIASNKVQAERNKKIKVQVQSKFWVDGINTILNYVSDPDFTTTFINFLQLLDLENISA
jgi:hypothetical protein